MLIYGKNSVISAINNNRVKQIYILENLNDFRIIKLIHKFNIKCDVVDKKYLNKLINNTKHQGVVAKIHDYKYYELPEIISHNNKKSIIIILDQIEDPHNLGAVLRVADFFNITGIIIKKNNQVRLNPTVDKISTGAINYIKTVLVSNLNNTIIKLKKEGYLIIAVDLNTKMNYQEIQYSFPLALIVGSESLGISSLIKKNSDFVVKIPSLGHVNSLNVSNALSIVLAHILK